MLTGESTQEAIPFSGDSPEDRERIAAFRRGFELARGLQGAEVTNADAAARHRSVVASQAFVALAEHVRDYAIFLMDEQGVITFWGEGARLIKWWTKEQAEGSHIRLLYPSGGSEDGTAEEHLAAAIERGEYSGEGQRVRQDGSTFWAGVTLTALRDETGTLIGFAKVTRDLSARRAADALLQAAATAAESARRDAVIANAAKSGFLATMSHEIRTPINAVLGYLQLLDLEINGPLAPEQRAHLQRATASARHLLELITEVLDFSRIEADRMTVGSATFHVGETVEAALALVTPQAQAAGLELRDDVGGLAGQLTAWGDEARVRQILINLLGNAVKFTTRRDGEIGRVSVSAGTATQPSPDAQLSGAGPWVFIRVEDTGPGISREGIDTIFEPFVQADMALTRTHGGTGLGLAICRRLARLMEGDVTVKSSEGVGSSFFLWLPAAPIPSVEPINQKHERDIDVAENHNAPLKFELTAAVDAAGADADAAVARPVASSETDGRTTAARAVVSIGNRHAGLRLVANVLLGRVQHTLQAIVARLRSDPATPSAHDTDEERVEDHLGTFLVDLAAMFHHIEAQARNTRGEPNADVRDMVAIQQVLAERHGAQRARLGWAESEVQREFVIIREELAMAIERSVPPPVGSASRRARQPDVESALNLLSEILAITGRQSIESFRRVSQGRSRERAAGGHDDGKRAQR